MSRQADGRLRTWSFFGVVLLILFVFESMAVHTLFTTRFPGTSDFYSRWAGARALLLQGRDPYSPDVTREIQPVIGIDQSLEGKGGFAYPLYTIFSFWPLAYLSYDWAQAIWMVTLQWIALTTVVVLLRLGRWNPSPVGLVGLLLGTLLLYPVARSIFLGQFTLHVTLFLAMALWALKSRHDGWAGVCLAVTFIKPQLVIFIVPWLVLWAIQQRRWHVITGLLAGGGILLLASMALFPRWPLSFLEDMLRYSKVAGGRNPLVVLMDLVWPGGPEAVRYTAAGLLILVMLASWWRSLRGDGTRYNLALHWTIVASLLVPFQTGTTSQVILLLPLFAWLHALAKRQNWLLMVVTVAAVGVALWVLFVSTIRGDYENPILFLPLPLSALAVLIVIEFRCWNSGRLLASASQTGGAK